MKEAGAGAGSSYRQSKVRSLLVVGEVSLALSLLIGAGLLIRTLLALRSVNPGFDVHNVVTTRAPLGPRFGTDALRRLNALPGVESAAFTNLVPLDGTFNSLPLIVAGRPLDGPSHGASRKVNISPNYFEVFRIPLIRGRLFTEDDRLGAPGVAIVNQALARQLWPDGDPIGSQVFIGKGLGPNIEEPARQIVGVVGDVHDDALNLNPAPAIFTPAAQPPNPRVAVDSVAWVIRTRWPSAPIESAIQNELRQATGGLPVPPLRSMEQVLARSTARQDFNMLLMTVFGASALLLAAIGIYGLMAYSVQHRTQEIGVRLALGAAPGNVRNMVVFQGMRLALAGVVIGGAAALGLARLIAGFLFGVTASDPVVFILAPILLCGIALLAVWLPARRASRVDPIRALRYE